MITKFLGEGGLDEIIQLPALVAIDVNAGRIDLVVLDPRGRTAVAAPLLEVTCAALVVWRPCRAIEGLIGRRLGDIGELHLQDIAVGVAGAQVFTGVEVAIWIDRDPVEASLVTGAE